jgi:O-antigen/teichoic acid export membrane protein
MILVRRVVHRRLALIQMTDVLVSAIIALFLAWIGAGLWALLSTSIVTLLANVALLYVWRPVWRARFIWQPEGMRYFLHFGVQNLLSGLLLRALDRVDDLWTGTFLGERPMGFYSRAYAFATYPRSFLAEAVNKVAGGAYAELKSDRKALSRAFFRSNAFLVRTGFLVGGLLFLIAPELVRIVLGSKWLPMLEAFRLMLVYTLLDPVKITVGNLFVAVGAPERVVRTRLVQLAVLVIGLLTMGPRWGIAGVALAVDIMLMTGMGVLLWQAREYVDFSLRRLFGVPAVGLIVGLGLALASVTMPMVDGSDWRTGIAKSVIFAVIYGGSLLVLERDQLKRLYQEARQALSRETL